MNPETDSTPGRHKHAKGRSLRSKLLAPFIFVLLVVSASIVFGSLQQISLSFTQSADERLNATQEILFREFKKQETILLTYASIVQHFQSLVNRFSYNDEIGILQDRLFTTLEESDISVTFYPTSVIDLLPQQSLVNLFDQVKRSQKPRFRYSNEMGSLPVLMVAAPLIDQGRVTRIMLLSTKMGEFFLRKISDPLHVQASLMNLEGQVIAHSHKQFIPIKLTPSQIAAIGRGEPFKTTLENIDATQMRIQVSAIPLGSTDLIFLALETSLSGNHETRAEFLFRILAIVGGCLLVGLMIYFRTINNIIRPARELCEAAMEINHGNFKHRIIDISTDELGQTAKAFNSMIENLDQFHQQRAEEDLAEAVANAEAKSKALLENKNREIDKINQELNGLQREMSAIYQLNQAMISATELPILFDRIMQVINETLGSDHLVLLLYNPGDSALDVVKTAGIDFDILRNIKFTFDQGITGEVAQTQRLIYVKDLDKDNRNLSYHGQIATRGSMLSVPLTCKGKLVGVLNLHKRQTDAFSTSDLKLIQAIANQTAIAIDNHQLLEKARDLTSTDELTGLANRRHFQDVLKREVAQARRFSSNFSIIMCDIDHFKAINDSHGRMHADALLRQVGQALLKNTRGIDLTCRFGMEQFVVMLPKTNKEGAFAAAEKLRLCIETKEFSIGDTPEDMVSLTMSFGVTEFPADSKNIYELLNLADRALYAARKEGCNRTVAWEGPAPGPE